MEKYFVRAVKTMNYLFLRAVVGKTKLDGILKEELFLFYQEVSKSEKINKEFYDLIKTEIDEGGYLNELTLERFMDRIASTIGEIMGEVNEDIYNLYTYIAGTVAEESNS